MYSNQSLSGRPQFFPPVVKWLLIANVALFVLGMIPMGIYPNGDPKHLGDIFRLHGALWPLGHPLFRPWQFITTMFLHGGYFHLLMNMFILWMFGFQLENAWGARRFLIFYLLSGIGASILHVLVTMSDAMQVPAVGASGAIMGVMVAFAMLYPNQLVFVGFLFPMRARTAVIVFIAIDLYAGFVDQPGDNIAHFAHLGGALAGYLLIKSGLHTTLANKLSRSPSNRQAPHVQPPQRSGRFSRADRRQSANIIEARFRDVPDTPPKNAPVSMDFGKDQDRIDHILDKISEQGYQSLTQEEKELLNQVSKK